MIMTFDNVHYYVPLPPVSTTRFSISEAYHCAEFRFSFSGLAIPLHQRSENQILQSDDNDV